MVGLPINSVVSPLLYDNKLRDFLLQKFQGIIIVIDDSIISVYIQQMWQKIKLNNIEENLLKTTLNLLKMLTSRIFTSIHFKESLMTVLRQ